MKKILISLLLLANLCSGIAFALDTHPEAMAGHNLSAIDLLSDDGHDHPDSDSHPNDHCSHGAAHLVGLIYKPTSHYVVGVHDRFDTLSKTPHILYIASLFRPPIV